MVREFSANFDLYHPEGAGLMPWQVRNGYIIGLPVAEYIAAGHGNLWQTYCDGYVMLEIGDYSAYGGLFVPRVGLRIKPPINGPMWSMRWIVTPPDEDGNYAVPVFADVNIEASQESVDWIFDPHQTRLVASETDVQVYFDSALISTVDWGEFAPNLIAARWWVQGLARIYDLTVKTGTVERIWTLDSAADLLDWQMNPSETSNVIETNGWIGQLDQPQLFRYAETARPCFGDLTQNATESNNVTVRDGYLTAPRWGLNAHGAGIFRDTSGLFACTDRSGRTKEVYVSGNAAASTVLFRRLEIVDQRETWSTSTVVFAGADCSRPVVVPYDDGSLTAWYMDGDTQRASRSVDDGRTWVALGATMLGSSLKYLHAIERHGITYACGTRAGNIYFVWSNDGGLTASPIPDSGSEQLVGPCGTYVHPCIVWHGEGKLSVFAPSDTDGGAELLYTNNNSGFGAWEANT